MKLTTTLNRIRACHPCASGYEKLVKHMGKDFDQDAEINLLTIRDSNGVADMLWCLRATAQESRRIAAQLAIEFAEQALPIFEAIHPNDSRPRMAIQAAREYLAGKIDIEELRKAREAFATADLGCAVTFATACADFSASAASAAAHAASAADAAAAADCATAASIYASPIKYALANQVEIIRWILE